MSRTLSEQDLVETYRTTIGPLYAYVSRRVGGDAGLAEDLVQDTWMRAIVDWRSKGIPAEPIAWLIRVARNTLISYVRRVRPQLVDAALLDRIEAEPAVAAEDPGAAAVINWGLSRLRRSHAQLLEDFYFTGKSVRDMARERSLSERAVEGRLRRAREKLRKRIEMAAPAEERNMPGAHEPREEFVNQLEHLLRADLRRRDLAAAGRTWWPQSRAGFALAAAAVVIVSMALGGGVVAASYEASLSEQRELLLNTFEQRAVLAQQRHALATQRLRDVQQRVSIGVEPQESMTDARIKVSEAEAELKSIELDIAEIKATGREPMNTLSAPLVSGRDFVTERMHVEMTVPAVALGAEKARVQTARTRFEVGLTKAIEVEEAESRLIDLESAVEVFQRKIAIRQTFLKGGLPGPEADLRGLEAETDLRRTALARRIGVARKHVTDLKGRIETGTANSLNLAEAELRLQELQLEMSKADYELLLIRKQLGK